MLMVSPKAYNINVKNKFIIKVWTDRTWMEIHRWWITTYHKRYPDQGKTWECSRSRNLFERSLTSLSSWSNNKQNRGIRNQLWMQQRRMMSIASYSSQHLARSMSRQSSRTPLRWWGSKRPEAWTHKHSIPATNDLSTVLETTPISKSYYAKISVKEDTEIQSHNVISLWNYKKAIHWSTPIRTLGDLLSY